MPWYDVKSSPLVIRPKGQRARSCIWVPDVTAQLCDIPSNADPMRGTGLKLLSGRFEPPLSGLSPLHTTKYNGEMHQLGMEQQTRPSIPC